MGEICFKQYLSSVVSAYQQWWRLYTLTDATGRESQRDKCDQVAPAFFDFGLMVQTVDKEKVESQKEKEKEEKKEKTERLPVLEGICKYAAEHVLLVGRPGSGKSTALARLLLQEAEKALSIAGAKIPVLVELRYLPSEANESSVCDRIVAFMHKHDPALDIDEAGIKQLLRQGRLLLLVDGVNELPSDRGRVMVNQFRELYQKTCPMIFTTRELSAGGDLGIAKRLEMQPLTEPQMQQFVMAYLPMQGEMLLRQLSGRLREFGQTPLLLWMLCSLFQHPEFKGQIPPNLGMVFRAFTVGYGDRIKQDVTLSKGSRAWWGRLLQYLAFKMTCGESLTELQVAISRRQAEQILVEFLRGKVEFADDCAVRWLEDLLKHHLIQISDDRIEFRHQLIQEYYAAEWLLGLLPSLSDARLQQVYLNYLKWTEPLALMLELVEGEEQAVRVVRLSLEVDLRLGARLAGAVKYKFQDKTVGLLLREIDERKIPQLYAIELLETTKSNFALNFFIQAYNSRDYHVRRSVAKVLGNINSDESIKLLIKAISDRESDVRWNAIQSLGQIGSDKSIEKLIESLIQALEDPYYFVRWSIIEALKKIGGNKAIEHLIQSLKDKDFLIRRNAAEALGSIGDDTAIEHLTQMLKDKYSQEDRYYCHNSAAEALARIGSDKALKSLIQVLKDKDSHIHIRESAAKVLENIRNDKAVDFLINLLTDLDSFVRWNAVKALGNIGSHKTIKPLSQALKDQDPQVRESAAKALGNIGSDKNIEPLCQALKDKDLRVRRNSAEALKKIGSKQSVEPLIKSLTDLDSFVRWNVAEALGNIGNDKAIEPLIQSLKNDKDSDVRSNVAEALGNIGNDKVIEPLIQALKDKEPDVRSNVAEALVKIGSDKVIQYLLQVLKDQNSLSRRNAAEVLGKIGCEKAVEALVQSLNDQYFYVRRDAAEALGKIGSEKAVEPLIQSLKDKNPNVQKNALEALKKIENTKILKNLNQDSKHQNYNVREKAVETLKIIDIGKAIDTLIQDLKDQNSDVRWKAVESLGKIAKSTSTLTQQLPHLLTLIPTESSQEALSVITAIQARCKYYNYDIAQTLLPPEDNPTPTTGNTYNFYDTVGQVIENQSVGGDNIAMQNNS